MVAGAGPAGQGKPAPAVRAGPLRLVFAGTPQTAVPSLTALLASRHEVLAVVSRPDAPAGRGRTSRPSPVREAAAAAGLPVLTPGHPREPEFQEALRRLDPDCCPVVAYGALVPASLLDLPRHGWVNLHFSLLPAWRGAAPVQHALLAGDEITGATTFRLEAGLDTGPVFGRLTEAIRPRDTAGELLERLAGAGAGLLVATLDGLEAGRLTAEPQPAEGVSAAPKLSAADAEVVWPAPDWRVDRQVRACTPAPGAWTTWRGRRLKLGPVLPQPPGAPGPLPAGHLAAGGFVGTATQPVRLGWVQPEGKGRMAAEEWLRGARPEPGEAFG